MPQKRSYTSMAKISRENRLRERKADKLARKRRRRDEGPEAPVETPEGDGSPASDHGDRSDDAVDGR